VTNIGIKLDYRTKEYPATVTVTKSFDGVYSISERHSLPDSYAISRKPATNTEVLSTWAPMLVTLKVFSEWYQQSVMIHAACSRTILLFRQLLLRDWSNSWTMS